MNKKYVSPVMITKKLLYYHKTNVCFVIVFTLKVKTNYNNG